MMNWIQKLQNQHLFVNGEKFLLMFGMKLFKNIIFQQNIGEALIITLRDKDGDMFTTFTTSIIKKEIENNPWYKYIRSTGKVEGKKYYGFDFV